MEEVNVVRDFYENGAEVGRLEQGLGIVEATRTNELLSRYVRPGMTVYDVGGGVGYYSDWLVGMGCDVTMFKLAPSAVEYAKGHCAHSFPVYAADARELPAADASCDVVLLMGPLYHLLEKESRMQALGETCRVLSPGGLLLAAGISKFSSTTWALSTYRAGNDFLDDEVYMDMLRGGTGEGGAPPPGEVSQFHRPGLFPHPGGAGWGAGGGRIPGGKAPGH